MKRRSALAVFGAGLALTLAACGGGGAGSGTGASAGSSESAKPADITVGVAMPTKTSERWIADGNNVKAGLEKAGYKVDLQYANDDIPTQSQQIDQMITKGDKLLIIAAIDGTALTSQLSAAASAGVKVISYDRLIRGSKDVDFYVSFDNYKVGVQQGTSLLTGLGLKNADGSEGTAAGPFNVELFAGSLDDNNAKFFWDGAYDTIKPYIDSGKIVVKSGQTTIDKAATLRWDQETAQKRMENLLTSTYNSGAKVDGVLSPYDGISRGIITALQNAGYGGSGTKMPVITGQDAEIASVKLINDGVQYSTIFKDTRKLADEVVTAASAIVEGKEPEANDTKSYNNGVKVVPSYLLESQVVTKDNVKSALVDTGYYTQAKVDAGK
ncbi:multiple monosaccharide ABC transporter substrate-binding protein [Kineococcus rhizosphaerae]|uniref:Monosaccharide ABC transporter substrate-binding protein (CUT2 family) n=1 Tax=Kineococcus rhizosphaerae TaxID=559628 RepID=A0A2T0R018_9ACTN|nr:multiple monosaccharide ABC transporter substrate-binding protein [Kineococcus rhizosphaerae]PRY12456.1 monosaccharide ABC transporter substrate-binding protein (CUT2 family) [Kineococcus rhizosphaerae]